MSRRTAEIAEDPLRIEEATLSDRSVVRIRAVWAGPAETAPRSLIVSLAGRRLGEASRSLSGGRILYLLQQELGEDIPIHDPVRVIVEADEAWAQAMLGGRLGPARGWFADATWTAHPDVISTLSDPAPSILLVGEALPQQGAAEWLPVANLAAALRQAGYRPVLLHFGEVADCAANAAQMLLDFDVVHHHTTMLSQRGWDRSAPGALPPVDRRLVQSIAAIARACGASMVMAVSPAGLNLLSKLPEDLRRGALMARDFVLAPRMIFSPVPREKAIATLRSILSGVTAVVEDEGLRLELLKWLPGAQAAVLPPAGALPLPQPGRDDTPATVAIGPTAAQAVAEALPATEPVVLINSTTQPDLLLAGLRRARCIVTWSDSGLPGMLAQRQAALWHLPLVGLPASPLPRMVSEEAGKAALVAMLTEFRRSGATQPAAGTPPWTATGFAAELGLAPIGAEKTEAAPIFISRLLSLRLGSLPERERTGMLVDPQQPGATFLAAACRAVLGKGHVFAQNPVPGSGLAPLTSALEAGIENMLVDLGPDRAAGMALMERVLDCGVLPLPLTPQASWADHRALVDWQHARRGQTAYIGGGLVPDDADLVLTPGTAELPADVVELAGPADPRRGRLLTLFAASEDAFWQRPPSPAIGYDRDPRATGLDILSGLAGRHEAISMLAMALHLGCSRVLLAEELAGHPLLADSLAALARAGVQVMPVAAGA
ncbi:hypothetical protein [Roseomonas marmotae]|uniref:Uncharacterized protein n=1 Tax=Roseomonas marmotae TaxID=2768161 RepID=A0ABS3KEA7_9PROT|nr:hypothetical protein [Roseomonas marmotae]MBO1075809.1 hypothetical protein [Roseomonas marmotae]